nr:MAG TPA: Tail tape measure [Caudoviricetes sp.]
MAGRLSFSIAINFLTENFRKGTSQVKAGFQAMQAQILTFAAALGAGGIGLSNLVTRFIEVAKETNRVTTALKNVSGSMSKFADNQRYLLDLAKKYGLEINALTGNYAKFTAAASVSGMSMQEQRKIFESLSRATTAFGMSAEDSNGVFLALSQMMSKGKISSEELRLQMGERLPIALQAMAKAAGTSVAGLDKLLKEGKLLSADVLPRFADALNEMIPNVDTDNLETSLNRLKNAFAGLVNKSDVQSKYKSIIDWLTGYIQTAVDNIQSLITYVVTAISVLVASRLVNNLIISFQKTELAAKAAARRAAKAAGQSFDEVAWKAQKATSTMRMMFANAVKSIKIALVSIAPTAIIAAIGAIVAKLVVMYQEAKRIKSLFSDYKAELGKSTNTSDIVNLQTQYKIATDLNRSIDERRAALAKINQQLNTNYSIDEKNLVIQGDLNEKFAERVELLKAAAEVDYLTQKKLEIEGNIENIQRKKYARKEEVASGNEWSVNVLWNGIKKIVHDEFGKGTGSDIQTYDAELAEQNRILADINTKLEQSITKVNTVNTGAGVSQGGVDEGKVRKTTLQKLEEKSAKELSELEAKYKIGSISQAEYNKALAELNIKLYAEASGSNDRQVLESDFYKKLKDAADAAVKQKDALAGAVELENVQKEYSRRLAELSTQKSNGLITEKQYRKNVQALAVEMDKAASSISEIGVEGQAFITAMRVNARLMGNPAKKKERDTAFDYKKTTVDIAQENLDLAKDYAKDLQEEARNAGKILDEELAKAMANVPDLEQALKIAQVRQDIKDLGKELKQGMFSGVKNIASSADRMVSAFTQLRDVMNDEDASAWERIMAVWNTMVNSIDGFMSIIQTIETLRELTEKLAKAKEAEAVIDTATTATKVTNATTEAAVDTATTAVETSNASRKVAANTAEGASDAGKSAAKLPFPANIIAIGAAIAAAIAAFAVIPKFANGGVVSGRTLAEVGEYPGASSNPEVIAPLSKLKDMIGGSGMANVRVEVGGKMQLDGDTAYLQLKNYGKRIGKKIF